MNPSQIYLNGFNLLRHMLKESKKLIVSSQFRLFPFGFNFSGKAF